MTTLVAVLYIVAFALFIYGLMGLTGPRTAVRGNIIAAAGMGVAVLATLLIPGVSNWALIVLGVVLGTVVGIPAAKQVKMTAMPIPTDAMRLPRTAVRGPVRPIRP